MLLPPGFRFHPTDEELIMYYLKRKAMGKKLHVEAISELNIYKFPPSDLPDKSCLKSKDREWYFFCPREKKYSSGARVNRATESGYWKTTGKDRPVHYNGEIVGMIKTLVFHQGRPPRGQRTDWVLHEYRILDKQLAETFVAQDGYVLCKVFHKKGLGPQNGAQYGAPFKEEEWDIDDDAQNCQETFSSGDPTAVVPSVVTGAVLHLPQNASHSAVFDISGTGNTLIGSLSKSDPLSPSPSVGTPAVHLPGNASYSVVTDMSGTENKLTGSLAEADPFSPGPSVGTPAVHLPRNASYSVVTDMSDTENVLTGSLAETDPFSPGPPVNMCTDVPTSLPTGDPDDDIFHLLASFTEDGALTPNQTDTIERTENSNRQSNILTTTFSDGNQAYTNGFGGGNLPNWQAGGDEFSFPVFQEAGYFDSPMLFEGNYLELNDLEFPMNSPAENTESLNVLTNNPSPMYNCYGGSEPSYFTANPIGSDQYFSGSSQLPSLPDGFKKLGNFSNATQVNGGGNNDSNQGYATAAYNFSFTQPDEIRGVQNNFRSGSYNCQ